MRFHYNLTFFKILFCLSWQLLPLYVYAQIFNLQFKKVDLPEDKSIGSVDVIFEDSRGFMWFGGLAGLYLYDGRSITHFVNDPNDSLSISDNKVRLIKEDYKGNLWIGTQNGINYFDVKKRIFKSYNDKDKDGIGIEPINEIQQDRNKNLWITSNSGIYKSDSNYLKFENQSSKLIKNNIGAIKVSETGIYFNSYEFKNNVGIINLHYKSFKSDSLVLIKPINANPRIASMDDEGILWLKNDKGISYIDTKKDKTQVFDYPHFKNDNIGAFLKKNKEELWVFLDKSLARLDYKTGNIQKFMYNSVFPNGYPKQQLDITFLTPNNILWGGYNRNSDLLIDNLNKHEFQNVPFNILETLPNMLCLYNIYEYSADILLIRTKGGTGLLNINTGEVNTFNYKPNYNLEGWKMGINCLLEEKEDINKLWISTINGLFLFDKQTKKFANLEEQVKDFNIFRNPFNAIRDLHKDRNGNLWIATWGNGVYKVDFKKKKIIPYLKDGLIGNTRSIMESKNGQIWIGTRNGLCKYIPDTDTFKIYRNIINDPESISENTAFAIYEDDKGDIWVGTYGGGLNKMDIKTEKFTHYTTKDGLIDNNVTSIMSDKKGNLWLSTFTGLSVFNPTTKKFDNFTNRNGLLNHSFSAFAFGKGIYSNRFYYSGNDGIDFFYPDSIKLSTLDPNIFITDFKLFNKTVPISKGEKDSKQFYLDEDISFTKHLTLDYEQNVVGFDFAALDYSAPKNIQYAYQLEGFDTAWQYVANQRSATFTNLNPGDYTFKVKATNGDDVWGTKQAAIQITVLAPWWQTWWFRGLVGLTLFSLGFAFYQYRISQIKEREAIKTTLNKRIAEVKMEALRSQMNPHFIFNALTSINLFILKNDTETASFYLNKFSRLMREVLDHSRSDLITVEEEISTLKNYIEIEKMRFRNAFNFILDIQPNARISTIQVPPLIIQPYVENAIWHGLKHKKEGEGLLKIAIFEDSDYFYIIVEDNGVGRAKAVELKKFNTNQHKSHGLNVTEERIKQYSEAHSVEAFVETIDLVNAHQQPIGTRIVFKIKTTNFTN